MIPQEDASGFSGYADAVFVPTSEAELLDVIRQASEQKVPLTVNGAWSGLTGGAVAQGGFAVSLEKLNAIAVHPGYAVVGAGALLRDLHSAAASSGQFYAPDPTETAASLGGTIATNASGSRSFLYGATRRHIRRLRAAFMDGTVREFRRGDAVEFDLPSVPLPDVRKNTAGYLLRPGMDWIDLLAGSEGTLAIITEAEVDLLPAPKSLITGVVFFADDTAALDAVDAWRPIPGLRMLEYLDRGSLDLLRARYEDIPAQAGAAVPFEQQPTASEDEELEVWLERLESANADLEGSWFAAGPQDRERFRRFRHALPELVNDTIRRNGFLKLGSDYAVPTTRNREMLAFYRTRLDELFPGQAVIFGHIGDAHVHVNLLPTSPAQFESGKALMLEFAGKAVELGGTVSAEHGLGKRKAHLLALQYTPAQIESMKSVKRRLDPDWLLNRGNVFG